jgi:periplasmic divalent cation tolerance protein
VTTGVVQVQTALPDAASAQALAATLLTERLAACVQVTGPVESRYWWQGQLEHTTEWLCLIKSTSEVVPRLLTRIRALHPYDTPELLVLPVSDGDVDYLRWVRENVQSEKGEGRSEK